MAVELFCVCSNINIHQEKIIMEKKNPADKNVSRINNKFRYNMSLRPVSQTKFRCNMSYDSG